MLEAEQVAQTYARSIAEGDRDFQAMTSPDLRDHVSGATGPETWDKVAGLRLQGIAGLGGAAIAGTAAGLIRSRVAVLHLTTQVQAR